MLDQQLLIKNNQKGFSLIVTLVLSFVALGFIAALIYLITSGIILSGRGKIYANALDAAKGITDIIIDRINTDNLKCNNGSICNDNGTIDNLNTLAGSYYTASATLLKKTSYFSGTPAKEYELYLISISVKSKTSNDKSEVEFAYEVEK